MSVYLESIDVLQLEISNFCNADCFHCVRTETLSSHLNSKFIPIDIFKKLLDNKYGTKFKTLEFCGTIDEPFAHPYFLDIIDVIYQYNKTVEISIHTNGSIRNKEFYAELAKKLLKFKKHVVRFSIDGLENSVYLYRGLRNYENIIDNARSFIDNGGTAIWQMILFPWNKEELDKCKDLAEKYNFAKFIVRKNRGKDTNYSPVELRKERENGRIKGHIIPYTQLEKYNQDEIEKNFLEMSLNLDKELNISCHFQKEKKMFLDHQGYIWPCCFLSNPTWRRKAEKIEIEEKLVKKYGKNFNSLYENTLEHIIESKWYQNDLVKSWTEKFHITSGCFSKCIKTCNNNSVVSERTIVKFKENYG